MARKRASREPVYEEEGRGGLLSGIGEVIAAHPSIAGGSAAFAVIFGFVSANALWYQPGRHPAPILKTRDIGGAQAAPTEDVIGKTIESIPARRVTTYRIERSDDTSTASIPVPESQPGARQPVETAVAAVSDKDMPAPDPLLMKIQKELKRKGFYGGDVDGLMGPMSAAGISNWQKKTGLSVDGEPSEAVLDTLLHGGNTAPLDVVRTRPRAEDAPAPEVAVTPVPRPERTERAAAPPPVTVPAAIPAKAEASVPSDLVRRIQSGLSNIAYADIAVDGVIGSETRTAIRAFEKHYRLPQTGEPNEKVLNKLVEIGAL